MTHENRLIKEMRKKGVLVAAHRGSVAGNIPFNSRPAFRAALWQGADIIETDVTLSADGVPVIFHPKQEIHHLFKDIHIEQMTAEEIGRECYANFDDNPTQCHIMTLDELLEELKGKCLINLDHAWDYLPETVETVRRHNMTQQIILKTPVRKEYLQIIEQAAPDIMYIPMIKETDTVTPLLESMQINYAGAEVLFTHDSAPVAQDDYIRSHHEKGRFLWVNAILYNYKTQLSGGHTDDVAVTGDPEYGWGWLVDRGFDIIQTDWVAPLRRFLDERK